MIKLSLYYGRFNIALTDHHRAQAVLWYRAFTIALDESSRPASFRTQ